MTSNLVLNRTLFGKAHFDTANTCDMRQHSHNF